MHKAFVGWFFGVAVVLVLSVLAAGWLVDPYGHFSSAYSSYPDFMTEEDEARFAEWQQQAPYLLNQPLFKVANFEKFATAAAAEGGPVNVVVGDSIGRQVDPTALARHDGQHWFTLAYGGATLDEMLVLVDHLLDHHDVGEIVWVLPFTKVVWIRRNFMGGALAALRNPIEHLFSYETVRAVFHVARHRWLGIPFSAYDPREPAVELRDEAAMLDRLQKTWSGHLLADIEARIARAEAMGVRVTLVTTPNRPSFQARVDAELPQQVATFHAFLARHRAIDAANLDHQGWTDEQFIDVYHLAATEFPLFNALILEARDNLRHVAEPPKSTADDDEASSYAPAGTERGGKKPSRAGLEGLVGSRVVGRITFPRERDQPRVVAP